MSASNELQDSGGGWIEWAGGECPVDGETLVEIEFACGPASIQPSTAGDWDWQEEGSHAIIAYRIVGAAN